MSNRICLKQIFNYILVTNEDEFGASKFSKNNLNYKFKPSTVTNFIKGNVNNAKTISPTVTNTAANAIGGWLYRGYTGHEMLPMFNLINMNGRLYDPINARMLSPDPIVNDFTNTQHFNRYSYVWNNPLKYTDPSGYDGWWDYDDGGDYAFSMGYLAYVTNPNGTAANPANGQKESFQGGSWTYIEGGGDYNFGNSYVNEGVDYSGLYLNNFNVNYSGSRPYDASQLLVQNGGGMKPASSYDYNQSVIDGKFIDDWNYILGGNNGNVLTRTWDLLKRDWQNFNNTDKQNYTDLGEFGINIFTAGGLLPIKILNKGNFYIKGVGLVDKSLFHKYVKQNILKKAGIQNYAKYVGDNPDVFVENGKVFLIGIYGKFTNKIYPTGLNAIEYFSK